MAKVKLTVDTSSLTGINLEGVRDFLAAKVERAFREEIGPHYVSVAKARAPVSEERDFNPRLGSKAFKKVTLRPRRDFLEASVDKRNRRGELESLLAETSGSSRADILTSSDIEFFRIAEGADKGATPDIVDVRRGGLVGAVMHKPGTLRDSIKITKVERSGASVTMTIAATAPYALPVHEGFTHRGGSKHTGKTTRIKGQKFLKSPLTNVRERLKNPSTYTG
jgi:hypothetical protein